MLRNGQTGHTWHLVVDHIMLEMKIRKSSPVNRLVDLYRGFYVHVQKKSGYLQLAVSSDWRKPAVNGYCQKKEK